jgi:hypothetical protein
LEASFFEAVSLNGAGFFDPLADFGAGFTGAGAAEFVEGHMRHFDMNIDPVHQGPNIFF